jgi:hypothetical protein
MEARVARERAQGVERVWTLRGFRPGGAHGAEYAWCAAGATTCWPGPRSLAVAKFKANLNYPRTRGGAVVVQHKANRAVNNSNYRLSAALHPLPLRHRRGTLVDLAEEYNACRSTIYRVIRYLRPPGSNSVFNTARPAPALPRNGRGSQAVSHSDLQMVRDLSAVPDAARPVNT